MILFLLIALLINALSYIFIDNTAAARGGGRHAKEIWFDTAEFVRSADDLEIRTPGGEWQRVNAATNADWCKILSVFGDTDEIQFRTAGGTVLRWRDWRELPTTGETWYMRQWKVDLATLRGDRIFLMTPYLRYAQEQSFIEYIPHGARLFDIGIGNGRSRDIWRSLNCDVWGVEPAQENIDALRKRNIPQVRHLEQWGGEDPRIQTWAPKDHFQVVMMSYSVTFFYESAEKLRRLAANIRHLLAPGGHLVIVGLDGTHVNKWLAKTQRLDNDSFTITKKYKKRTTFGNEIEITMKSPQSLVTAQTEYLVDFAAFIKEMGDFTVVKNMNVTAPYYLSEWPAKFAAAQRILVMRKSE